MMVNSKDRFNGRFRSRRGATLVFCAIILVVLLAICALVIDLGFGYLASQQLQNIADAAALAGADKLREELDQDAAREEAVRIAASNTVLKNSQIIDPDDVIVGCWDDASGKIVPWDGTSGEIAVQVTARRTRGSANGPIPTFFAKVWGINSMDITRTATAGISVTKRVRKPVEMIIVQDASGSFTEEWKDAIDADLALVNLVNGVSIEGDLSGFVAFSEGLKSTTYAGQNRALGKPRKVNSNGDTDTKNGRVMALQLTPTEFDYSNHSSLPSEVNKMYKIFSKDNPGGNTYPASALNWAIDWFEQNGSSDADKVIVFVSDGMPNPSSQRAPANQAAGRAGRDNIKIHSVTLTDESGGPYGAEGSDYAFNKALVERYNNSSDGKNMGGAALQTSDPSKLRDLLIGIGKLEIGHPRLIK